MDRTIAILLVKGGSKHVDRKNIELFYGKTLVLYSIHTALVIEFFKKGVDIPENWEKVEVIYKLLQEFES